MPRAARGRPQRSDSGSVWPPEPSATTLRPPKRSPTARRRSPLPASGWLPPQRGTPGTRSWSAEVARLANAQLHQAGDAVLHQLASLTPDGTGSAVGTPHRSRWQTRTSRRHPWLVAGHDSPAGSGRCRCQPPDRSEMRITVNSCSRNDTAELTLAALAGSRGSFGWNVAPTALAVVKSCWRRCAELLLFQIRPDLEVGVDRPEQPEPKVRMLAMTERTPASFCGIVGRFPGWILQESTQPNEMVQVQMQLLPR
jgi:hypothetical protein